MLSCDLRGADVFSVSLGISAVQSVPLRVLAGPLGDVPCFMGHLRAENE